ncbi:hypothetical protein AQUCO_00100378v1 [Aquilegia coerulea]|uniref:Peptidase C14 caspase domain-containing protein n=1 Tax=Aquilegia coerulea TaxID=218851 RepID=A0A2G5FA44_AQUCA|nr:hypothetical protein AQUCO_00100378v1 [Aquilegia coerulea]
MSKKAILVGCNYPGTQGELKGCINDVVRMYQCLIDRYGFMENDIYVMVDTDSSFPQPTGINIRNAFSVFCESAGPGDSLFFHFSGHGTRLPAEPGSNDNTGYDECIVPSDMNLITDDDFREFVDKVPHGCRITIVSDSCHSGGLIDNAKEQIGESTKCSEEGELRLKDFLRKRVGNSLDKRGIHLPLRKFRHGRHGKADSEPQAQDNMRGQGGTINRALSLSTLIAMLKQKTGKQDITAENLKLSLCDIFGDDTSPKIKKAMVYIVKKLKSRLNGSGAGGKLIGIVGNLALDFAKQKLEEKASGSSKRARHDNGILISGCQTDQTSADTTASGNPDEAYGALSNAIQIIIAETDGRVTNQELVLKAREILESQGLTQRPGLYCSDNHVGAFFLL